MSDAGPVGPASRSRTMSCSAILRGRTLRGVVASFQRGQQPVDGCVELLFGEIRTGHNLPLDFADPRVIEPGQRLADGHPAQPRRPPGSALRDAQRPPIRRFRPSAGRLIGRTSTTVTNCVSVTHDPSRFLAGHL